MEKLRGKSETIIDGCSCKKSVEKFLKHIPGDFCKEIHGEISERIQGRLYEKVLELFSGIKSIGKKIYLTSNLTFHQKQLKVAGHFLR